MGTVSGLAAAGLIDSAKALGLCDKKFCEAAGWAAGVPTGEALWRCRISTHTYGRMWELLVEESEDEAVVIRLASRLQLGGMGLLGYAMMSCDTLGAALGQMARAKRLLNDDAVLLMRCGGRVAVRYELALPAMPGARCVLEQACISLVGVCRWLTGTALVPVEIWTTYPAPPYAKLFEEALGATLLYGRPYNACFYTEEAMARPLVGANLQLHTQFAQELQRQLDALEAAQPWATRVVLYLEQPWPPMASPTLVQVAAALHSSPRTLQRHLSGEGVSFRGLLQEARAQTARRLLQAPQLSIEDIATQVGFSEASTFSRAFRHWTGLSPRAFRTEQERAEVDQPTESSDPSR